MPDNSITRRAAFGAAAAGAAALGGTQAMAQPETRKTFVLVSRRLAWRLVLAARRRHS